MNLSQAISLENFFKDIHPNPQIWRELALNICLSHGIQVQRFTPFTDGVNLVAVINDKLVIKIFPPFHKHQWESDNRTLEHLQGKLTITIPEHLAAGELDHSWTYLLMSKIDGVSLESTWASASHTNKRKILFEIGKIIAEVHKLDTGDLKSLTPNWEDFIPRQLAACVSRHEKKGLPTLLLKNLEAWLKSALPSLNNSSKRVILTGEYTPFNLLAARQNEALKLVGMIDFGDSMVGFPDYDLLGPSSFLCAGDPELVRSLFDGYGYSFQGGKTESRRRLMLLLLLHRYSDLNSQLRIENWSDKVKDFDELAALIWPF